jgi:hypothetical protein
LAVESGGEDSVGGGPGRMLDGQRSDQVVDAHEVEFGVEGRGGEGNVDGLQVRLEVDVEGDPSLLVVDADGVLVVVRVTEIPGQGVRLVGDVLEVRWDLQGENAEISSRSFPVAEQHEPERSYRTLSYWMLMV